MDDIFARVPRTQGMRSGSAGAVGGVGSYLSKDGFCSSHPIILQLLLPPAIHILQLTKPCSFSQATVQWCHSQGNSHPFCPGGEGGGPGLQVQWGIGRKGRQGTCQGTPGFHEAERGWLLGNSPPQRRARLRGVRWGLGVGIRAPWMKEDQRQNPNQSRPERTEAAGNISAF